MTDTTKRFDKYAAMKLRLIAVGRAEAHAEGRAEGRADVFREVLVDVVILRFGECPPPVLDRIANAPEPELRLWVRRAVTGDSLEAVFSA